MAQPTSDAEIRVFFGSLSVVVVESGSLERDILMQVLTGFKVKAINKYPTTDGAIDHLQHEQTDLLIVGAVAGEMDAYAFIRWVRQSLVPAVQTLPVILLTGHTQHANVIRARDCGANFVVAKPITPHVLYGRVSWLARDPRKFVTSDGYTGPDRRFQASGPPAGMDGRRKTDLSLEIGEASMPNMLQADIDAMLSGKGAVG